MITTISITLRFAFNVLHQRYILGQSFNPLLQFGTFLILRTGDYQGVF